MQQSRKHVFSRTTRKRVLRFNGFAGRSEYSNHTHFVAAVELQRTSRNPPGEDSMFFNSRRLVRRLPRKAGWLVSGDPWHELIGTTWSSYVILIRSITSIIPAVQPAGLPRVSNSGPSGRLHMSSNIRRATSTYSGFARSLQTVSSCLECIVVPRCFWSPPISFCRTSLQENSVSPASYGDAVIKVAERKTNARPSSVRLQIAVLATLNGGDRSPCLLCFAMQAWPPQNSHPSQCEHG